ncbi:MAG: DUF3048 C-terminal domain-containing protein [Aristaeellaceae bacterium]
MMKRLLCAMLALSLVLSMGAAMADEEGMTRINPTEKRNITVQDAGLNEVIEGVSPTTGLYLDELDAPEGFAGLAVTGRYMPMLVQIDNTDGGVGDMAPWGASYADILYETPLHARGMTRISALFSDLIPDSVGPVRSARLGHVWLREEWDCGFLFYGQQEHEKANVLKEFSKLGTNKKGVLFSGIVSSGKPWKKFYTARKGATAPHHIDANVAAMYELIPQDHVAANHTFLFTDELPTEGDSGEEIIVRWIYDKTNQPMENYGSNLEYDVDTNAYYRYMRCDDLVPYEDRDSQEQLAFANVIVQFTQTKFLKLDVPVTFLVGQYYYTGKGSKSVTGNADIFMGGKHIAGCWKRDSMTSRTVFYGPDGKEIELQRGKTLIIICPENTWVDYR